MRRLVFSIVCASLCFTLGRAFAEAPAQPAPATPQESELNARLTALRDARADAVRAPMEHARLALQRAKKAAAQGDDATRQRCLELAHAAVSLAEARAQLVLERALHEKASQRRKHSQQRAERARALLERVRQDHVPRERTEAQDARPPGMSAPGAPQQRTSGHAAEEPLAP